MAIPMNLSSATVSNYDSTVGTVTVPPKTIDAATGDTETEWINPDGAKFWGYFNNCAELKSALLMCATWVVGKGYTADPRTMVITDHVSGWGKDSFTDILFNMEVTKRIFGDAFAHVIRDEKTKTLINLKPLDQLKIVCDSKGRIKRYKQISKIPGNKEVLKFDPEEIFHLSHNRLVDQIHGISDIAAMEKTVLAEYENFEDMKKLMHLQVRPLILWKLKTDNMTKINAFVAKIAAARKLGDDMFIPDDESIVTHEIVQINPSPMIMAWREDIKNKFYRALGLPLILFGAQGSTESGGKIEYTGHEQIWEKNQKYLEEQIWNQLFLRINLIPPASLINELQTDQSKDGAMAQMNMQPSDMQAGVGK